MQTCSPVSSGDCHCTCRLSEFTPAVQINHRGPSKKRATKIACGSAILPLSLAQPCRTPVANRLRIFFRSDRQRQLPVNRRQGVRHTGRQRRGGRTACAEAWTVRRHAAPAPFVDHALRLGPRASDQRFPASVPGSCGLVPARNPRQTFSNVRRKSAATGSAPRMAAVSSSDASVTSCPAANYRRPPLLVTSREKTSAKNRFAGALPQGVLMRIESGNREIRKSGRTANVGAYATVAAS